MNMCKLSFIVTSVFCVIAGVCFSQSNTPTDCVIEITEPSNNTIVIDNNQHESFFMFGIRGRTANLNSGNNICIYQKLPGGKNWWRSGEPIGSADLGPDGSWSMSYASCGEKNKPHSEVIVKAVVQQSCPPSGAEIAGIENAICESPAYTFRSR